MKRDIEIIKALLKYVRDNANGSGILAVPNEDELRSKFQVSDEVIHYHVELCVQARFLKVVPQDQILEGTCLPVYGILYLTWWGHEYLDGRRNRGYADWSEIDIGDRDSFLR